MSEFKSLFGKKSEETAKQESSYSYTTKSAARAKPMRRKAAGVRTGSIENHKAPIEMTKEEKKQLRRERAAEQDRIYAVANILLKQEPGYKTYRTIWWGGIIAGLIMVVISWYTLTFQKADPNSFLGQMSVPTLVLAYIGIFGAFIFDIVKIRPMRNEANRKASSMTQKRQMELIEKYETRK